MSDDRKAAAVERWVSGETYKVIARDVGVSKGTVARWVVEFIEKWVPSAPKAEPYIYYHFDPVTGQERYLWHQPKGLAYFGDDRKEIARDALGRYRAQ